MDGLIEVIHDTIAVRCNLLVKLNFLNLVVFRNCKSLENVSFEHDSRLVPEHPKETPKQQERVFVVRTVVYMFAVLSQTGTNPSSDAIGGLYFRESPRVVRGAKNYIPQPLFHFDRIQMHDNC